MFERVPVALVQACIIVGSSLKQVQNQPKSKEYSYSYHGAFIRFSFFAMIHR